MTQYMLSVHHIDGNVDLSPEEMQQSFVDVDRFNQELIASHQWVFAGGLEAITSATLVDGRGTEPVITDGPFAETKEILGGFWVIEAADLDEAIALAARGSKACGAAVEVRPFQAEPPAAE